MLRSYLLWGLAALVVWALTGVVSYWYFVETGTHDEATSGDTPVVAVSATPVLDTGQAQARQRTEVMVQFCESSVQLGTTVLERLPEMAALDAHFRERNLQQALGELEESSLLLPEKRELEQRLRAACGSPGEQIERAVDAYLKREFGALPPDLASLLRPSVTVLLLTHPYDRLEYAQAKQEVIRTFLLWKAAQPQPVITRYIGGTSNEWRLDRLESRIRSICLEVDCY